MAETAGNYTRIQASTTGAKTMTIAQQVKETIETKCPGTFSLYAGYGMAGGQYVRWPTGHQEAETRNKKGQCSMARYRYADNSTLTYKRRPNNQYALIVGANP